MRGQGPRCSDGQPGQAHLPVSRGAGAGATGCEQPGQPPGGPGHRRAQSWGGAAGGAVGLVSRGSGEGPQPPPCASRGLAGMS